MSSAARGIGIAAFLFVTAVARATTIVPPSFSELVAESDTIVRGVVTETRSEEFDSPSGRGIRTLVTLRVERTLKGSPGETLTLTLLGGKVGARALRVSGVPEFRVGDRQFVFVADNGRVFCPVIAGGHGRFHVRNDAATGAEFIVRDNGAPLLSLAEVGAPLSVAPAAIALRAPLAAALTPAAFEAQIQAAATQPPAARLR